MELIPVGDILFNLGDGTTPGIQLCAADGAGDPRGAEAIVVLRCILGIAQITVNT